MIFYVETEMSFASLWESIKPQKETNLRRSLKIIDSIDGRKELPVAPRPWPRESFRLFPADYKLKWNLKDFFKEVVKVDHRGRRQGRQICNLSFFVNKPAASPCSQPLRPHISFYHLACKTETKSTFVGLHEHLYAISLFSSLIKAFQW